VGRTVERMTQLVDWDAAIATAGALGKTGPKVTFSEAADVVADLRRLTDVAEKHVREFTALTAEANHPPVRVVDRRDWAAANVDGLRNVIDPIAEQLSQNRAATVTGSPLLRTVGAKAIGVQAGTVLAFLSGKVLGQYEVFGEHAGQLLLVAPNVVEAERALGVQPRDFRLWVCLHEVTHRTQFSAVPWLRDHFLSEVRSFLDVSELDPEALAERLRSAVSSLAEAVRERDRQVSLIDLVQTPAQRAVMGRLTALMTLLEGHAEYVMDGVGPEVVPSVESIRAAFDARRRSANPVERALRRLLGLDMKLRQYAEGKKFVGAVVERVEMAGLNRVWESPETLPRPDELGKPEAWVARVHGPSAA
jgi:coenzyme F420 biosynthesis associated uncharacterized protein